MVWKYFYKNMLATIKDVKMFMLENVIYILNYIGYISNQY